MKNRFYTYLIAIFAMALSLNHFLAKNVFPELGHTVFYISIGLITILTLIFHFIVVSASKKRQAAFNNSFLISTSVKLFVMVSYATLIIYIYRPFAKTFAIHFILLYLIFTLIEVTSLLSVINGGKKNR